MKVLPFFSLVFLSSYCLAQNSFRKNIVYAEFCGSGLNWSANYERQLGNKPGLGLHAGVGYASSNEQFRVSIPVGVNYIFNISHQRSFVETGIGVTWAEQNIWESKLPDTYFQYEPGLFASVGYRYQAPYGLIWKIDYTPFFTKYRNDYLFLGISVGWSFR